MPLTNKGQKIKDSMRERYGKKKGESVFYASKTKVQSKVLKKPRKTIGFRMPKRTLRNEALKESAQETNLVDLHALLDLKDTTWLKHLGRWLKRDRTKRLEELLVLQ
jgi:hypothetical protein